jgi:hypothetical protein
MLREVKGRPLTRQQLVEDEIRRSIANLPLYAGDSGSAGLINSAGPPVNASLQVMRS